MADYLAEAERVEKEATSQRGVVRRLYLAIGELYRELDRRQKIRMRLQSELR